MPRNTTPSSRLPEGKGIGAECTDDPAKRSTPDAAHHPAPWIASAQSGLAMTGALPATTTPVTPAQHDGRMLSALHGVRFGHFNRNTRFIEGITLGGVKTARQRWWLTSLVVRHRKQVKDQQAVAIAEAWLRTNAEPTAENGPQMTPMSQMKSSGSQASEARASVASAPSAETTGASPASDQPTLF